jgi:ATP-dependent Clp protease, protease subunit
MTQGPDRTGRWAGQQPPIPPEVPPLRPPPGPEPPWPILPRPGHPPTPEPPAPGSRREDFHVTLDLADRLLERRIVLVAGTLDHDAATRAAAQLMLLDADGDQPLELHLSCPDGDLDAAVTLAETLDLVHVPVRAVARGSVGGPPVAVYAAAGRRVAHPHTAFWLKEPRTRLEGRADELAIAASQHEQLLRHVRERLAAATGRSYDQIAADMRSGLSLTAEEAVGYGLVHALAHHDDHQRS